MSFKAEGGGDPEEIDRFDGGVGWIAHPEETMRRASHALATDAGVYVVDPVEVDGVADVYADLGEVTGVVVALNRHLRDAATVARRHDVPVYAAEWVHEDVVEDLPASVEVDLFKRQLPGTDYRAIPVVDNVFWTESALFDGETLLVPEAVGTSDYFLASGERLGVHPALRAVPPRKSLGDLDPERVLVGHGAGVHADATAALENALAGARRRTPGLYAKTLVSFLPG